MSVCVLRRPVKGTWRRGTTSASHVECPGLNPQCVRTTFGIWLRGCLFVCWLDLFPKCICRQIMTPAGLEPATPGSVGRSLFHWATGPAITMLVPMCPDIAFGRRPPGTLCVACVHHGRPCGRPPREHGGRGKVSSLGRWPRKADPEGPQVKHSGHVPKTAFLSYVWEFSLCRMGMWTWGWGWDSSPSGENPGIK